MPPSSFEWNWMNNSINKPTHTCNPYSQPAMAGSAELKWGSGLIGFSPIACLFLLVVTKRPELVIIAILG